MSKAGKRKRKRKGGRGSKKGSSFERQICKQLSLWWSGSKRDDIFWRTAGSGSRATHRGKRGLATKNSNGDVAAIDMDGLPLLDVAVISLKNGYKNTHASAYLDKPGKGKFELEEWFKEIKKVWQKAGSYSWMVIHRRTGRAKVIYMPCILYQQLTLVMGLEIRRLRPCMQYTLKNGLSFVCVRLDSFLENVSPELIKQMSQFL